MRFNARARARELRYLALHAPVAGTESESCMVSGELADPSLSLVLQHGEVVGHYDGPISFHRDRCWIPQLIVTRDFQEDREFIIQAIRLALVGTRGTDISTQSGGVQRIIVNAECRLCRST